MTADERIARLEKWLRELYRDAEKEMRGKWDEYLARQEKQTAAFLEAVRHAKTPQEKKDAEKRYKEHMTRITAGNRHYRAIVNDLAEKYADAAKQAAKIMNGERYGAFADGYNYGAKILNGFAKSQAIGIRFDLLDPYLVEYLANHRELLLLPPKDDPSDLDMEVWNVHNINAQVTQGIVQGEGCEKIADRLNNVTHMNEVAAIRTARTMVIGSRNAGHLTNMERAAEMGIQMRKKWNSSHDNKVRDTHADLDASPAIPLDEVFANKCRYPGDLNGGASECYNCRCYLTPEIDGFSSTLPKEHQGKIHVTIRG